VVVWYVGGIWGYDAGGVYVVVGSMCNCVVEGGVVMKKRGGGA
jgi:hypothetical protein